MMSKRRSMLLGLCALLALPSLSAAAVPATVPAALPNPPSCDSAAATTIAGIGCCEGRKGVCGCRAGRIVCCDGSASDTCSCHQESEQGPRL